jgi:hypothetical protein
MKLNIRTPSEKMKSVKASCMSAPFGEKRAAAMKHYYSAETAHIAKNDAKMNIELDAAMHALPCHHTHGAIPGKPNIGQPAALRELAKVVSLRT